MNNIGKRIKERFPKSQIIALEPTNMPLLSSGKIIDNHKIEGIGDKIALSIYEFFKDQVSLFTYSTAQCQS